MGIERIAAALVVSFGLSGCLRGFVYTDVTLPLVTNMNVTKVGEPGGESKNMGFNIPFSRVPVSASWHTQALGEAAKRNGISTIYFADVERLSILGGIWQSATLHIVGEKAGGEVGSIREELP
jgi:hypothetical protein